jgi:hypothetical protein
MFVFMFINANATKIEAHTEPSLCSSYEVNIASCEVDNKSKKAFSICAESSDYGKSFDSIHYRYGTTTKVSLEYTANTVNKNLFYRGIDMGTYTTFIGFKNIEHFYTIGIPPERHNARAFLTIYRDKKVISNLQCQTNSFGMKNLQSQLFIDVDGEQLSEGKILLLMKK